MYYLSTYVKKLLSRSLSCPKKKFPQAWHEGGWGCFLLQFVIIVFMTILRLSFERKKPSLGVHQ